ncbi:MAG: 3-carboxy-cis,cis-muconate cycloisomerase [Alphaproteobacteria bacterium]|nr:3-carboxy-cis,cis-muconate cycloisomerase [Alphaproteobacteria bacterium]MBU1553025.1 3-carboxy-cis,cis-muconate cycloisomerase [Alphaproteobacteria bacterium]MBU2338000.1 3-carboxy-cis,cis-muconate cycloisomerase [Alphaproteobacteria bacterium]MBU2386553.1 3-carboxy-cis,cis-muconate cycloisomerase [Alphaproteobacteria bacterium]
MTPSAFSHPYLCGLLGDEETARQFSAEAEIAAMLGFELALANAEAAAGLIPVAAAERIGAVCGSFVPDMEALRAGAAKDGVVVPELVRQLKAAVGADAGQDVHMGATSQDVIDTALMLRLQRVCALFVRRLGALDHLFQNLDGSFGSRALMGHTRMQAAIPITVADRIRAWREPLQRHRGRLEAFSVEGFAVQFGGAAGTLDRLGDKGVAIRHAIAKELGLADVPQWQSQRDCLAEFGGILSLVSGSLGKFGQDVALLAELGGEIELAGGGGSSAMSHKQNPVAAEVLVSLARFNAVQISGLHQSLVHEQERSGAAWTLEWLILPQMAVATGATLRIAAELVRNIRSFGRAIT